jgi:hypothetical protein
VGENLSNFKVWPPAVIHLERFWQRNVQCVIILLIDLGEGLDHIGDVGNVPGELRPYGVRVDCYAHSLTNEMSSAGYPLIYV